MTTTTRKRQLARKQLARCSQSQPDYRFFLELIHKYEDLERWFQRIYTESPGVCVYMTYLHL